MKKITFDAYLITRLLIYGLVLSVVIPIVYLVGFSFTDPLHLSEKVLIFFPSQPTLKNYQSAFQFAANTLNVPIWLMFVNSSIYTLSSVFLCVALSSMAAFGFSNYKFRGKEVLFLLTLASMTIPLQSLIIPLFLLMKDLHLLNSYLSIVFPYTAIGVPFSTLLLRGFFEAIPKELRDAAYMDGASDFVYFLRVVLRLSTAPLATCITVLFLTFWNEFLLALVLIQSEKMSPLTLALSRIVQGRAPQPLPVYAAIILIGAVPIMIVFILFQRWFIKGVTAGAIKG